MPRTAAKVTKTEIERVIKAANAGGFKLARLEVEGGKIVAYGIDAPANGNLSAYDEWSRKNGDD